MGTPILIRKFRQICVSLKGKCAPDGAQLIERRLDAMNPASDGDGIVV